MGNPGRKQYAADFKRDAVALVIQQGYSVAEAAKNLGVNAGVLRRWKTEMERTGAFPGKGHQMPDQAELHHLREENRRLRMERDILKKATVFFASDPR
jgi:transposase